MKNYATLSTAVALATILGATVIMPATAGASNRIRLECRASGAVDISMHARYESRNARLKFSTEFEARPGTGFVAGDVLFVQVKGVRVGKMTLETVLGGDLVGDLNFDTRPQPPDSFAFPAKWPAPINNGTAVKVLDGTTAVLGCNLR